MWLNNPRRPLEASGTSGMKVVLNGGLNLSVLDGWWAEAYDGRNGFTIGLGETHVSTDVHDSRDRDSPCFLGDGELESSCDSQTSTRLRRAGHAL